MPPQLYKQPRTDYTKQLRPRRHSMDGLSSSKTIVHSRPKAVIKTSVKPASKPQNSQDYRISISINIPDYNQWRITKFGRHYPYLSLGLVLLGLLALALSVEGLLSLWHGFHHHNLQPAIILLPRLK